MTTIISPNGIYNLSLCCGYISEANGDAITIYNDEDGNGVINITSYKIPGEYDFNIEEELRDFATSVDNNVNGRTLKVMNNNFSVCEFISQGRYWKAWVLFKRPYAVFASYNCDANDKNKEIDKVDDIMRSLKMV